MDVKVNYVKNQIHYCKVNYKTNDKLFEREYVWNKSAYNVTTDKKASTLTKKAYYSVMNFYEKEPIGVKEVFLEKQNVFAPLKVLGNHKYSVMVDGDECTYTYKNGILQELYVDGMIDIHLKIK